MKDNLENPHSLPEKEQSSERQSSEGQSTETTPPEPAGERAALGGEEATAGEEPLLQVRNSSEAERALEGEAATAGEEPLLQEEGAGEVHPRTAIRSFLREVIGCAFGMEEEGGQWPELSVEVFHRIVGMMRDRGQQLLDHIQRIELTDEEGLFFLRVLLETVVAYARLDWSDPIAEPKPLEPLALFAGRPGSIPDFNQLYCTSDSTERRIERLCRDVDPAGGKVLFLGDDDLGSVLLASRFAGEVHMLDLDERILDFVAERAPAVKRHRVDLVRGGIPPEMFEAFDAVVLDPHWFYRGACFFLDKAFFCLRRSPHARVYLSLCPSYMDQDMNRFQQRILKMGFVLDDLVPFFNWYNLSNLYSPNVMDLVDDFLKQIDSLYLQTVRQLPQGFSHLYVLRRSGKGLRGLRRWFFEWWNAA